MSHDNQVEAPPPRPSPWCFTATGSGPSTTSGIGWRASPCGCVRGLTRSLHGMAGCQVINLSTNHPASPAAVYSTRHDACSNRARRGCSWRQPQVQLLAPQWGWRHGDTCTAPLAPPVSYGGVNDWLGRSAQHSCCQVFRQSVASPAVHHGYEGQRSIGDALKDSSEP